MKSGGTLTGGSLVPQYHATYALYPARFIESYRDEGISLPAIVRLQSKSRQAEYLLEYCAYGHFMKFLQSGAMRVASDGFSGGPSHVAFRNPDESIIVVIVNPAMRATSSAAPLFDPITNASRLPWNPNHS